MKILVTCPPMLGIMDQLMPIFERKNIDVDCPDVVQTLSETELVEIIPKYDGWIIGDDPASFSVFEAGTTGNLKAAVKWGVGIDNVDFDACQEFSIPITNTPAMFGTEVADIAMSYVVALARDTFFIDREVRGNRWPKPRGISLKGKTLGLVGFGDIGKNVAKRAIASDMNVLAYDPFFTRVDGFETVMCYQWPDKLEEVDFIVFTCALTKENHHMLNAAILAKLNPGVRIVNVARGPLIDEKALVAALDSGRVYAAALDVMEEEPLPKNSPLRHYEKCIFGSHNASNTEDAVLATSHKAIALLFGFLGIDNSAAINN